MWTPEDRALVGVNQRWVSTLISAVMHCMFTNFPRSGICADEQLARSPAEQAKHTRVSRTR
jgi:hypothetical protein